MSEENVTNGPKKNRRRGKIHSKHAKSLLLYARLAQTLAEVMEDRGMYSDTQLEELAADRDLVRQFVRMLWRRKFGWCKDTFSMVPEPQGRSYTYIHRRGGELLEMVNREFPHADYWFKNWLPGISGGFMWNNCLSLPAATPAKRTFRIVEVRRNVHIREFRQMIAACGWHQAFLYDLFHVRNYESESPLFVLETYARDEYPYQKKGGCLGQDSRSEFMNDGDRILVWREQRDAAA